MTNVIGRRRRRDSGGGEAVIVAGANLFGFVSPSPRFRGGEAAIGLRQRRSIPNVAVAAIPGG